MLTHQISNHKKLTTCCKKLKNYKTNYKQPQEIQHSINTLHKTTKQQQSIILYVMENPDLKSHGAFMRSLSGGRGRWLSGGFSGAYPGFSSNAYPVAYPGGYPGGAGGLAAAVAQRFRRLGADSAAGGAAVTQQRDARGFKPLIILYCSLWEDIVP